MSEITSVPAYADFFFKWKFKWRLARKNFLIQSIWYWIPSFLALAMIWNSETWEMWWIIWTMFWITFIPLLIQTHIKRFHDLGYNWLWITLEFTIFLTPFILIFLYFLKWTNWPNKYWFDTLLELEKQKKLVEFKDNVLIIKPLKIDKKIKNKEVKKNQDQDTKETQDHDNSGYDFD